jgi:hypothetical protein
MTVLPLDEALATVVDRLPVGILVVAPDGTPVYANAAAHALLGAGAGFHATVAGTGRPYPTERTPVVRALGGETSTVDDMVIERGGETVPVEVWAAPVLDSDAGVAYALAVFQDVTERIRAQADAARLSAEILRQARWLAAVREVQLAVLSGGLDDALDLIARRARDLLAGDTASIGVPEGEGWLVIRAASGRGDATLRGARLPLAGSIMGEVIGMSAAAVLDEVGAHGSLADPVSRLDMGPAVFVPLAGENHACGALCVARGRGAPLFSEDDVVAIEAFANQAAMAVQIGWAQRDLAEELHTGIARSLSSVRRRLAAGAVHDAVAELDQLLLDVAAAGERAGGGSLGALGGTIEMPSPSGAP